MSFACYQLLAEKFFTGEKAEYLFALLFLLVEWNLMARADNIVNLSLSDFEWSDDSLIIYLQRSKTDQEGNNAKTPYHVYANPLDPRLSVPLVLGMYLSSNPGLLETGKLFEADHQYSRYARILRDVIEENADEFERIGVKAGRIGSHSARKGAATLAASGCTVSPSMAAICNRAGWKMGGTRDKYIKYENAGDQFLGRTLCGLNSLVKEFSISSPFFNASSNAEVELMDRVLRNNVVGAGNVSARTFEVLRMCTASCVYHHTYLSSKLHPTHRFRSHPLFNNLPVVCILFCFVFCMSRLN